MFPEERIWVLIYINYMIAQYATLITYHAGQCTDNRLSDVASDYMCTRALCNQGYTQSVMSHY